MPELAAKIRSIFEALTSYSGYCPLFSAHDNRQYLFDFWPLHVLMLNLGVRESDRGIFLELNPRRCSPKQLPYINLGYVRMLCPRNGQFGVRGGGGLRDL